jgi:integrase/ribosomal protein L40E
LLPTKKIHFRQFSWFGCEHFVHVRFYIHRKKTKSPITAFGDIKELRLFYQWLIPDKEIVIFKPRSPRHDVPPERILTAENVQGILQACGSQRDRALVMTFWDSAARLNEILDCNVGHVKFDRYGAIISVNGKTGRRPIRLVSAVPDLQDWLSKHHPLKDDPNAPLFVTSRRRGTTTYKRLNKRTVQNLFARLGDITRCPKDTNPHAFRHGRLTSRGKQLTESELREYAGWSKGSNMAAVYVHLSSRDIDQKILTLEGMEQEPEDAAKDNVLSVVKCSRCSALNAHDAIYCSRCSLILDERVALKVQEMDHQIKTDYDLFMEWAKKRKAGAGDY